jgi:uncharacterized protein (TIGR03437 family)
VTIGAAGPIGGISVAPLFAGLTPGFVGLYQINVVIPDSSPRGELVPLLIDVNGVPSNVVYIAVQ